MRILPILFNTDMVRAILDGRKTVTRRVVKLPKHIKAQENGLYTLFTEGTCYENQHLEDIAMYLNKPCEPGDILYVRETWNVSNMDIEENTITFIYKAEKSEEKSARTVKVSDEIWDKYNQTMAENNPEWRPSLHMPREAARIFLKVKDVRVERLQEITEEQAKAEGVPDDTDYPISKVYCPRCHGDGLIGALSDNLGYMEVDCHECDTAVKRFKHLWDSTIKKPDLGKYGWGANPWVWVIEFERCEKPDNFIG